MYPELQSNDLSLDVGKISAKDSEPTVEAEASESGASGLFLTFPSLCFGFPSARWKMRNLAAALWGWVVLSNLTFWMMLS